MSVSLPSNVFLYLEFSKQMLVKIERHLLFICFLKQCSLLLYALKSFPDFSLQVHDKFLELQILCRTAR